MASNDPFNIIKGGFLIIIVFTGILLFVNGIGGNYGQTASPDESFLRYSALKAGVDEIISAFNEITVESQNIVELTFATVTGVPKIIKGSLDIMMSVPETIRDIMVVTFYVPESLANLIVIFLVIGMVGSLVWAVYKWTPTPTNY